MGFVKFEGGFALVLTPPAPIVEWKIFGEANGRYYGRTYARDAATAVRNHPLSAVTRLVAKEVTS